MQIPIHEIIFYVFTVILIASAMTVITAKNPVKGVLSLVVAFFASSVLWMLTQAEFLALVLIFVYVGAVMTLFLFVVMMIPLEKEKLKNSLSRFYPFAFILAIILVAIAVYALCAKHFPLSAALSAHYGAHYDNITEMGVLLFTKYLLPFEMAALLLLVGMVAAITLAFHGKKPGTKTQNINQQLDANKKDRMRLVDLK